jgi:hypothetical protein
MEFSSQYDPRLGCYMPAIPLPFYRWQFWKFQSVECCCGQRFISRDLGLMPPEYEAHYALTHMKEL